MDTQCCDCTRINTTADTFDSIVMGKEGLSQPACDLPCQLTLAANTRHGQPLGPRSAYGGTDTNTNRSAVVFPGDVRKVHVGRGEETKHVRQHEHKLPNHIGWNEGGQVAKGAVADTVIHIMGKPTNCTASGGTSTGARTGCLGPKPRATRSQQMRYGHRICGRVGWRPAPRWNTWQEAWAWWRLTARWCPEVVQRTGRLTRQKQGRRAARERKNEGHAESRVGRPAHPRVRPCGGGHGKRHLSRVGPPSHAEVRAFSAE